MGMLRGVHNRTVKTVLSTVAKEVEVITLAGVQLDLTVEEAKWLRMLCGSIYGDTQLSKGVSTDPYLIDKKSLRGIRLGLTDRLHTALDTLFEREEGIGEDAVTLGSRPATQWDINNHKW